MVQNSKWTYPSKGGRYPWAGTPDIHPITGSPVQLGHPRLPDQAYASKKTASRPIGIPLNYVVSGYLH